jgi:hypothetical protein
MPRDGIPSHLWLANGFQKDLLPPEPAATINFPVDDKVNLEIYCATVAEYFPEEENEENADLWLIVYDDEEMKGFTKDELDEAPRLYAYS